jgi:hypothetical protein
MFIGKVVGKQFLLFHDSVCVITAPRLELETLDRSLETLACSLLTYYFLENDGEALAEVKASELCECVSRYLPNKLEFTFEDSHLDNAVELAIRHHAVDIFEDFCGQQLYIQTLHGMLASQLQTKASLEARPQDNPP